LIKILFCDFLPLRLENVYIFIKMFSVAENVCPSRICYNPNHVTGGKEGVREPQAIRGQQVADRCSRGRHANFQLHGGKFERWTTIEQFVFQHGTCIKRFMPLKLFSICGHNVLYHNPTCAARTAFRV
jgi:hypothetical protein